MFDVCLILIKYQVRSGAVIGYDKGTDFEDSDILHRVHVEHKFRSSKFNHRKRTLNRFVQTKMSPSAAVYPNVN